MGPIQSSINQAFGQALSVAALLYTQTAKFKMKQETKEQMKKATDLESRQQKYLQDYGKDVEVDGKPTKIMMTEEEYMKSLGNMPKIDKDKKLIDYRHDVEEFNKYESQLSDINSQLYAKGELKEAGTHDRSIAKDIVAKAKENLINSQLEKRMTKEMR